MTINNKIKRINNSVIRSAEILLERMVKEETGREIEVKSLFPLEYEFKDIENAEKVYHIETLLLNNRHYRTYKGREEFCIKCHDYGMSSYDYGKEISVNGKTYKIVGFFENTHSGYFILMGKRGGLWVTKAEKR